MLSLKYLLLYFGLASQILMSQTVVEGSLFFDETKSCRTYKVWLPDDYDSTRTYQTVYCFDGEFLFNILAANIEIYSDPFIGVLPPTILVGVFFDQRNNDMGIEWSEGVLNSRGTAFMNFVEDGLIPAITSRYNVSGYRSVVGHSNSTTFAHFFLEGEKPLFRGFLTLSQFELSTDVLHYTKLKNELKIPVDLVTITGGLDTDYRIGSGEVLEVLLDSIAVSGLSHTHIMLPEANHLTIVPQGIPLGLETLYKSYGERVLVEDVIEIGCLKVQSPIVVVDSIINEKVQKYGVDFSYSVEDLDLLFELFVVTKDSAGVSLATKIYADLLQDSTEYFYEAQCLDMMGAYRSAEVSYLKHLNYSGCIGYWSYIRLVWLYASKLNDELAAIDWCAMGLKKLEDVRFLRELEQLSGRYPKSVQKCIVVLEEYVSEASLATLKLAAQASLAKLYRKAGYEKKALYYERLSR